MLEGNWPYTSLMEQVDQVESVLPHLAGPDELIWRWQTYSIFNVSNGCCFDTGASGKSMSYPGRGRNPAEFFCLSICNQKGARFLSFATPKCARTDWNVMFVVLNAFCCHGFQFPSIPRVKGRILATQKARVRQPIGFWSWFPFATWTCGQLVFGPSIFLRLWRDARGQRWLSLPVHSLDVEQTTATKKCNQKIKQPNTWWWYVKMSRWIFGILSPPLTIRDDENHSNYVRKPEDSWPNIDDFRPTPTLVTGFRGQVTCPNLSRLSGWFFILGGWFYDSLIFVDICWFQGNMCCF